MTQTKSKLLAVPGIDFDRSYAGTQYLLEELCAAFDVTACIFTEKKTQDWYRRLPIPCRIWPFQGSFWNAGRLRLMSKMFRLYVLARMLASRYVLITESAYLREAALAKKLRGRRMVLVQFCQELFLFEEWPAAWTWSATQKKWGHVPDIVIDVDPFRARIRKEYYRLKKLPHVLRNTLPHRQLPPRAPSGRLWELAETFPPPAGAPILVYTGGIFEDKPFNRIVDAVAGLKRNVFLLAFCTGPDALIQHYRNYAATQLAPGSFCLHRAISREQLRASLWEADVGIVDYSYAAIPTQNQRYCAPTKLYEYMACGLAILGSNNDSLRDVIEREGIGLCARGDAPADLTCALGEMLRQDLPAMKARAREAFATRYSYETACVDEVRQIAEEMRRLDPGARDGGEPE